jgi:pilus assembly protein CpaE
MENIRVIVVDDSEEMRKSIVELLSFEKNIEIVGQAGNGEEAVLLTKELRPHIVLMDINMPVMDGLKATEEIAIEVPESAVIMMSVQGEQQYFKKAMAAGARDFLVKPFSPEDIVQAVVKIYELESKKREMANSAKSPVVNSKVISVFSTKGGVGKTTIASNLAIAIARITKKRVVLVDLDLNFGDAAIMLNLSVKNTISDLVKDIAQIDKDLIEDYLEPHFSGVQVLAAPIRPEYAEYITAAHVEKILSVLKECYDYIIIDTCASFHETILTSIDKSDRILYVATLDLPTIKNVKAGFNTLESLRYPKEKIDIILNKASEQFGIKYKDFEVTLKHPIWAYVPEDSQTVITAANRGFPFVMKRMETKVGKAIMDIANRILE